MENEILDAEQLAARFGVGPGTIRKWAREGRIPEIRLSSKVRRFDYGEVLKAVRKMGGER